MALEIAPELKDMPIGEAWNALLLLIIVMLVIVVISSISS